MEEKQELPQGWVLATLAQLLDIRSGFAFKSTEYSQSGIPILRISNIVKEKISFAQDTVYWGKPVLESDSLQSFLVEKGDTLLAMSGATTGKIGVYEHDFPALLNQRVARFRPLIKDEAIQKYSRLFLSGITDAILANAYGAAQPNISASELGAFTFPLPPLPEQRRIVAKLEELFSRLDAGVAAVRRTQALLKRYRQSVLHAAVTGELTRAWREAHPAPTETGAALLARIRAERRAQWEAAQVAKRGGQLPLNDAWKSKYVEPDAPVTSELPELPAGWVWVSFSQLIVDGPQNGLYLPSTLYGDGSPIVRIDDYQSDWSRSSDELRKVRCSAEEAEKYGLRKNDIVINRVNSMSHIGKSFVVEDRHLPSIYESNMMRLALTTGALPIYINLYLCSRMGRASLTGNAKQAVNQASINQNDVNSTIIAFPPLAEQSEIVAEVERRFTVLDALSQTLTDELKRAERLRQSLLHRAFTGRLVPQDATDEPAAALLDRLREGVAAPAKAAKGGRKTKTEPESKQLSIKL